MQRCSKKAFAMCTTRHLCGRIDDATFTDDSECAEFNRAMEDKPMTNADRIRSMSDDELAAFLCNLRSEKACDGCLSCVAEGFCRIVHTGMIDWLQQPAEGE